MDDDGICKVIIHFVEKEDPIELTVRLYEARSLFHAYAHLSGENLCRYLSGTLFRVDKIHHIYFYTMQGVPIPSNSLYSKAQ